MSREGYHIARHAKEAPAFEYCFAKLDPASRTNNMFSWQEALPTSINSPLAFTVLPAGRRGSSGISGSAISQPAIFGLANGLLQPTAHQPYVVLLKTEYLIDNRKFIIVSNFAVDAGSPRTIGWAMLCNLITN